MAVLGTHPPDLSCRPIRQGDWDGVADCLRRGFPERSRKYWMRALARLSQRPVVADFPQFPVANDYTGLKALANEFLRLPTMV